jgi:hypothetical protein
MNFGVYPREVATMSKHAELTHDEIVAMAGDLDDAAIAAILEIGPTAEDLVEALAWVEGEDDVMGEMERPLTGKVAQIYDILTADQDDEA